MIGAFASDNYCELDQKIKQLEKRVSQLEKELQDLHYNMDEMACELSIEEENIMNMNDEGVFRF